MAEVFAEVNTLFASGEYISQLNGTSQVEAHSLPPEITYPSLIRAFLPDLAVRDGV
mgnify:CR=1 FL=1